MSMHPEDLRNLGIEPFGYTYQATHTVAEARGLTLPAQIALAGRIIALRRHGRLAFADLADSTGFIQIMIRANLLEGGRELLAQIRIGDFIGARGELMHTVAGELSLAPVSLSMLSAATISPPFAVNPRTGFSGVSATNTPDTLTNPETCARQRYLDLAVHPKTQGRFRARSTILRTARRVLDARRYQEVETPILQQVYGGAQARPFRTHYHNLGEERFLRIAPELYLRRLLVGGLERVYEVARCFRNEGLDRTHTPEFTMLEIYEAYADYTQMMALTEEILRESAVVLYGEPRFSWQGQVIDVSGTLAQIDFSSTLSERLGFEILSATADQLRVALPPEASREMGHGEMLDFLFSHHVEPSLTEPCFIINHPLVLSPLARTHRTDARLAERFELYIGSMEIGNAYTELCDPVEIEARLRSIAQNSTQEQAYDADFAEAARYGLPPSAGLGIGIDRLVMLLTDTAHIRDVQLFPPMRVLAP